MLITPEPSVLVPSRLEGFGASAAGTMGLKQFAEQVDRWIVGVSAAAATVIGAPPDRTQAIAPSDALDCDADGSVTARSGVAWIESDDATLVYCDGSDLKRVQGVTSIPVATGTWVSSASAGTLSVQSTSDILKTTRFPEALREFHRLAFSAIGRAIEQNQKNVEQRIAERVQGGERLTERVVSSFHSVAKQSRRAWEHGAHEDERLLAVFMIVAEAIGLDLPQREREKIGKAKTLDEAVRSARLRQRQVTLRGAWWQEDYGPLIGFVGEERRVVALLPTGDEPVADDRSGRWWRTGCRCGAGGAHLARGPHALFRASR